MEIGSCEFRCVTKNVDVGRFLEGRIVKVRLAEKLSFLKSSY